MKHFFLIFIFTLFACEGTPSDSKVANSELPIETEIPTTEPLTYKTKGETDSITTTNDMNSEASDDFKWKLQKLSDKDFDSLMRLAHRSAIPLKPHDEYITDLDSCIIITLSQADNDTICNIRRDEYYENYRVRGFWEQKNQLLVHFENWEESLDYLINISSGEQFTLTQDYGLSPSGNFIVDFTNEYANPMYSNSFIIAEFTSDGYTQHINITEMLVTNAIWLSNYQILIESGTLDQETWKLTKETKYLLELMKNES
jgi:hypothetical protein